MEDWNKNRDRNEIITSTERLQKQMGDRTIKRACSRGRLEQNEDRDKSMTGTKGGQELNTGMLGEYIK